MCSLLVAAAAVAAAPDDVDDAPAKVATWFLQLHTHTYIRRPELLIFAYSYVQQHICTLQMCAGMCALYVWVAIDKRIVLSTGMIYANAHLNWANIILCITAPSTCTYNLYTTNPSVLVLMVIFFSQNVKKQFATFWNRIAFLGKKIGIFLFFFSLHSKRMWINKFYNVCPSLACEMGASRMVPTLMILSVCWSFVGVKVNKLKIWRFKSNLHTSCVGLISRYLHLTLRVEFFSCLNVYWK